MPASRWTVYAVKVLERELLRRQSYEENVRREVDLLRRLRHPNITQVVAVCETERHLCLVLEYAAMGDLHTQIATMGSLSAESARFTAAEIAASGNAEENIAI